MYATILSFRACNSDSTAIRICCQFIVWSVSAETTRQRPQWGAQNQQTRIIQVQVLDIYQYIIFYIVMPIPFKLILFYHKYIILVHLFSFPPRQFRRYGRHPAFTSIVIFQGFCVNGEYVYIVHPGLSYYLYILT